MARFYLRLGHSILPCGFCWLRLLEISTSTHENRSEFLEIDDTITTAVVEAKDAVHACIVWHDNSKLFDGSLELVLANSALVLDVEKLKCFVQEGGLV